LLNCCAQRYKSIKAREVGPPATGDFHKLFHPAVEKRDPTGLCGAARERVCRRREDVRLNTGRFMRRLCVLAALGCATLAAQGGEGAILAPYYPTPAAIVEKMLQLGGLKAGEKMFDLGSGDGRIVIMAAQKFHAQAVGI
jgi:hypothetical protein